MDIVCFERLKHDKGPLTVNDAKTHSAHEPFHVFKPM